MQRKKKMQNKSCSYYIDKTECLEEGIRRFPSIYIEGNATIGKSVAVEMLLRKHPEVASCKFDFDEEESDSAEFMEALADIKEKLKQSSHWVVFENLPKEINLSQAKAMAKLVRDTDNDSKVIFVSREKPQVEFLDLLWKGKMQLIGADKLLLTQEEVSKLADCYGSDLNVEKVFEKTRGWAGCTDLLFRLSENEKNPEELLDSYEVRTYIQKEVFEALDESVQKMIGIASDYPWVNAELCEQVWGISNAREQLTDLHRKGTLLYDSDKQRWRTIPLFQRYVSGKNQDIETVAKWYELHGHISEAAQCLKNMQDKVAYRNLMCVHYDQVFALGLVDEAFLNWTGKQPELCYLRGIYWYRIKNFEGLKKEIGLLDKAKEKDHKIKEILINLLYMDVETPLMEWLNLVEEYTKAGEKFRLYQMLGNSVTYLCGIRDLSALFACSKREEKQRGSLWKDAFGEAEWECYRLAKLDYYLETDRKDSVTMEEWALLLKDIGAGTAWQLRVAKLYLLCKLQRVQPEEERAGQIRLLEASLRKETSSVCRVITESIGNLYAPWFVGRDRMSRWLRFAVMDSTVSVNEENYLMFYCRAKGYILLNQYDRAEKILKKLVPYLQEYHRYRLMAEALFQSAVVHWSKDLRGQAVKNAIESMVVTGGSRYVIFYAAYGQKGLQVLEDYEEWMRNNAPEGWSRKKKYNYGNVLRMPVEDYVQVVLRCAKRALKEEGIFETEQIQEHLTMMETIVLQDLGMGKSNAQICQELGLKLPTVKGHVYSLFKKLGVNSRVQAVIKGKELGILE